MKTFYFHLLIIGFIVLIRSSNSSLPDNSVFDYVLNRVRLKYAETLISIADESFPGKLSICLPNHT